jgi:hypothetical protein
VKIKKLAAAVAVTVPVSAAIVGTAQPAYAAYPIHCYGAFLCMQVQNINGNVATIKMWPNSISFYGHFELQMPNHRVGNSPQKEYYAGRTGYTFANWNGGTGKWCGTAWSYYGTGYRKLNYGCVSA